jgi:hypothetical protein
MRILISQTDFVMQVIIVKTYLLELNLPLLQTQHLILELVPQAITVQPELLIQDHVLLELF